MHLTNKTQHGVQFRYSSFDRRGIAECKIVRVHSFTFYKCRKFLDKSRYSENISARACGPKCIHTCHSLIPDRSDRSQIDPQTCKEARCVNESTGVTILAIDRAHKGRARIRGGHFNHRRKRRNARELRAGETRFELEIADTLGK